MVNDLLRTGRQNFKRATNTEYTPAVLGNGKGLIPVKYRPSYVWVRVIFADSRYGLPFPVLLPGNSNVSLKNNASIKLGWDEHKRRIVLNGDTDGILASGTSTLSTAPDLSTSTRQGSIATSNLVALGDMLVALRAWNIIKKRIYNEVSYPNIDLSSYVPSSGDKCYALIAILADLSDVEITTSTPRAISDMDLGRADVQECIDALLPDSTPAWVITLIGDQVVITQLNINDGNNTKDLRQLVNAADDIVDRGSSTLAAGTVVVSTTRITATSLVFLTAQDTGNITGILRVSSRVAGTSFTILSSVNTDTADIAWMIMEP